MEQSLGKRISQYRKSKGLTQDKLAEQLGVTAQAVSKWENDQSCPDITMLPKLAEIFDITTDELLGRQPQQIVHHAEVVDEEDTEEGSAGIHFTNEKGGNWSFTWDSGRKHDVVFALWVLLVGGLCVADAILQWEASFWDILWPSFLLTYGVLGLTKRFNFFSAGCTLFGGYFLISNLGVWHLNLGAELIWPVIIVLFGLGLLLDALRKPKKPRFKVTHNGKRAEGSRHAAENSCEIRGERFECSLSFGDEERLITMPRLSRGEIGCSFGNLTVDLCGCEEIADRCYIEADCSFGELVIKVPAKYQVKPDSDTAFGSFNVSGHPDPNPVGTIVLDADVSFGDITVEYI